MLAREEEHETGEQGSDLAVDNGGVCVGISVRNSLAQALASLDFFLDAFIDNPLGELSQKVDPDITVTIEDNQIKFTRPTDQPRHRSMHGLYRALVHNMVVGVSTGFEKKPQWPHQVRTNPVVWPWFNIQIH